MVDIINEIIQEQMAYTEKSLAEIITKYEFIVGSKECKYRLMELLPDGANIICSQYITDPTMIYAIKKYDIADLIEPYKAESEESYKESDECHNRCKDCVHGDEPWYSMSCDPCCSGNNNFELKEDKDAGSN